jgi:mannose-6-phosphate isomerase-like protein (cupin superfamily)
MSTPSQGQVRERLLGAFAHCSGEMVDRFCWLLAQPADVLIARAVISLAKPYGTNHLLVTKGGFGVSFACLRPGQGTSFHYHALRRELFWVRAGNLHLVHGDTEEYLSAGDVGESTPGVPHSLGNNGDVPLEVLEVFAPALVDDKVRLTDRYDRILGPVGLGQ